MKLSVRIASNIAHASAWLFFKTFFRLRVEGAEHMPPGGVVLVANHTSMFDPPLVQTAFTRLLYFTPRVTLGRSRFYRWLTAFFLTIPIERGGSDLAASRRLVDLLRGGAAVLMFPEQTRSRTGRMGPLRRGFHLLARRAGVPVLPVVIHGAFEALPRGRRWPRLVPLRVRVGPPMEMSGLSWQDAAARVVAAMKDLGAVFEEASGEAAVETAVR